MRTKLKKEKKKGLQNI